MAEAGATAQQKEAAMQQLADQHEQIEKYAQTVEQELENKLKIEQKLSSLEKRVLHGGVNMVEKMSELKKLAKATKAELEVQRWGDVGGMHMCTLYLSHSYSAISSAALRTCATSFSHDTAQAPARGA